MGIILGRYTKIVQVSFWLNYHFLGVSEHEVSNNWFWEGTDWNRYLKCIISHHTYIVLLEVLRRPSRLSRFLSAPSQSSSILLAQFTGFTPALRLTYGRHSAAKLSLLLYGTSFAIGCSHCNKVFLFAKTREWCKKSWILSLLTPFDIWSAAATKICAILRLHALEWFVV